MYIKWLLDTDICCHTREGFQFIQSQKWTRSVHI